MRTRVDDTLPAPADVLGLRLWLGRHMEEAGYRLAYRAGKRSYANPITRRIVLRDTADLDSVDGVALLAHEVAHARQQSGPWWYRLAWGAWYMLNPWFRRAAEVEAEAWWTAAMMRLAGVVSVRVGDRERTAQITVEQYARQSHTLGGWRSPHLTPGDPDEMTARIAKRAREILA